MRVQSPTDFVYYLIARLPLLLIAAGVAWVLVAGLHQLETFSFGTEFTIGNHETANELPPAGGVRDTDVLMEALGSGDVDQMAAALDEVEARRGVPAGQ